ncbi:MAG: hypothetical protein KC456_13685 [Flavobacteriales bacterium]|jgi:hypothetical protein|nr:hypothetical protein [Flavobacteriales bacterium]
MKQVVSIFIAFLFFTYLFGQVQPSELKINGVDANHLVVDRIPDYGNGHKDGCIVMGQISMEIDSLEIGSVSGRVYDSESLDFVPYATIKLYNNDKKRATTSSNEQGYFHSEESSGLIKIEVEYLGYRNLVIDLSQLDN